jgi:phage shock protein PspC (stress-responsive transcriptional regulator)
MIGGLCSGIAKYFEVDVLIIRLFVVAATILSSGLFSLVYLIGCLIIKEETE